MVDGDISLILAGGSKYYTCLSITNSLFCTSVADNKEHMTTPPQVDGNNIPSFLTPDMLDYYVNEACFDGFSSDGINLFDDSLSYGNLPDLDFVGTHMIYDFSTLEDTTEAANYQYVGSCEEFQEPMLDSSCFNLICHQAKPPTEELDARSFQFDSERVDYTDPETFIKNLLEVSDKSNLLPALVSKETSKKNDITLVLDLDGNSSLSADVFYFYPFRCLIYVPLFHLNLFIPKMYKIYNVD
jgi:hypothetical protein